RPDASQQAVLHVHAIGRQIYECAKGAQDIWAWQFKHPEAELFDESGKKVGNHGAGPSWTLNDGSSVVGQVQASMQAPMPGAIPWLLLNVKSHAGGGMLNTVTSIQRLATQGGVAPVKDGCTSMVAGQIVSVVYTADYAFWSPKTSKP
ncbi:DUF3455 domain-containing protein, partial [Acidithiobacillus sp. MC2.1]